MNREAARHDAPDQITERQLDQDKGLHARDENERNSITQDQLNAVRKDSEPEQIHEAQLKGVRTEEIRETITEDQLNLVGRIGNVAGARSVLVWNRGRALKVAIRLFVRRVVPNHRLPASVILSSLALDGCAQ